MKRRILLRLLILLPILAGIQENRLCAQNNDGKIDPAYLPKEIYSGLQGKHHVQGVVVDLKRQCVYFSFTTRFLKTDLKGNPMGSVDGLIGHLGCLTLNPEDGRVYGSLEYKNDAIGKGIEGSEAANRQSAFYVAIFDVDKITRMGMSAETDGVMTTVYLKEVVEDYYAEAENNGKRVSHRYGCSGIDGITFAPEFGKKRDSKYYLHVAYGIYGENDRTDNDYQVILAYEVKKWRKYEQPLSQRNTHSCGPKIPRHKYFIKTGNTTYGIQNLVYDFASGNCYAAAYKGTKPEYPNYSLFVIDGLKKPDKKQLDGFSTKTVGEVLSLLPAGLEDSSSKVRGWNFLWGTTGLAPIGNGYFYISHEGVKENKQNSTLYLYKWTGECSTPFQRVE